MKNIEKNIVDPSKNNNDEPGILTGLHNLDAMISGLYDSELILLASRPSMGKTTLALEIAEYAAMHENKTVLFLSLAMSVGELCFRLNRMIAPTYIPYMCPRYINAKALNSRIKLGNLIFDARLCTKGFPEIRDRCYETLADSGLDLIVIDYLGLLRDVRYDSPLSPSEQEYVITQQLKNLAGELHVPIILTSQLYRYEIFALYDKRPDISFLQRRNHIDQIADVIILLYRDDYYRSLDPTEEWLAANPPRKNIAELIIAKQSHGPLGTVFLSWLPESLKFVDLQK